MARLQRTTISRRTVEGLKVEKDTVFWDSELSGFGVRVYPSGSKYYVVQTRAGGKAAKRVTVGRHGVLTAEEARRRAALVISRIKAGEEPVPEPLAARLADGPTVGELAAVYLDEHVAARCKLPVPDGRWRAMSEAPQILLEHRLKTLKLPTVLREYDKVARQCAHEDLDHVAFLARVVELELIDRERRLIERRIKAAKFPTIKSLDSFQFKAIPSLNKTQVLELARCEWIERRENVIALGPSGTGKTHVAQGLGLAACQRGLSVRFVTAAALVHELMEARDERTAAAPAEAVHQPHAVDHRRAGLRPVVQDRSRAALRARLTTLRARRGPHHL